MKKNRKKSKSFMVVMTAVSMLTGALIGLHELMQTEERRFRDGRRNRHGRGCRNGNGHRNGNDRRRRESIWNGIRAKTTGHLC